MISILLISLVIVTWHHKSVSMDNFSEPDPEIIALLNPPSERCKRGSEDASDCVETEIAKRSRTLSTVVAQKKRQLAQQEKIDKK